MTDKLLALITAAVDGELSATELPRFQRLLDSSSEARTAYHCLKADSDRLRNLTVVTPPANLLQRVMGKIAALTPTPRTLPISSPRAPVLRNGPPTRALEPSTLQNPRVTTNRWIPVAIAASLLLAIMGSSFWFFSGSGKVGTIARNSKSSQPAASNESADAAEWAKSLPSENSSHPLVPMPGDANRNVARTEPIEPTKEVVASVAAPTTALAPAPRPARNSAILGAELKSEIPPLDLVQIRVPFLRPLAEFDRDDARQQFVEELGRDPAFRIDVFTRHLPRSVEWFRNAAKASGVNVSIDATTLDRANKGQISSVVVYIETMTPKELADLFGKLCAEDARVTPRIFEAVHATPVLEDDSKALRSILGVDPGLFKRPAQEKKTDSVKPISAGTVDQIVKSLSAGQGREPEKSALLMTWKPDMARTIPSTSAELKQFLIKRGDRKANAVPVMIVIRHGNG
jgi:hypothetical protein